MAYFRFLSAQKLTTPMMLTIATAAIIATVVSSGVSVDGSIGTFGDDAGPTVTAVDAPELP